ncbi:unnamed protein product [Spirodela intermedia]|uniref:Nitroreductase domain-containing protein n=1 Tax=Spirodela intermedia TaxID=51605 RepID=A0A7I8J9P4_SPIIN|nr:unnamed protein product [Spirodela intermedia]CAA6666824.1 unnamed protein product [Spirodela intermedia]
MTPRRSRKRRLEELRAAATAESVPPDLPKAVHPDDYVLRRIARFHNVLTTVRADEPVEWEGRPEEFLHYIDPFSCHPLQRPPLRRFQELGKEEQRAAALYARLFSGARGSIAAEPLSGAFLSQLLYDCLAVSDGEPPDFETGFLPRVVPSSGGSHPTVAHIITPADHALEVRAVIDPGFFAKLPDGVILVGLCTIYARETWRHGNRAFRYCHLDIGHAIAAVAFAAAALGWDARVIEGLGQRAMERLMGLDPFRPSTCSRGKQRFGRFIEVEKQDPACVLIVFPNTVSDFCIDHGKHVVYNEVYRTTKDVENYPCTFRLVVPRLRFPASCSISEIIGHETLMAREVIRNRRSSSSMDPTYEMEAATFYNFLHRCLPTGSPYPPNEQTAQDAFPFVVLPWNSRMNAFIVVHRVKTLPKGLYCLARNEDHLGVLQRRTQSIFLWHQNNECVEMRLPLYALLPWDMAQRVAEIAFNEPVAVDGCFTMMIVGPFGEMDYEFWLYPQFFWEAGVLGHLLSLDAEALGLCGRGIGSFFDNKAKELLTGESGFFQTIYLYSVGKPLSGGGQVGLSTALNALSSAELFLQMFIAGAESSCTRRRGPLREEDWPGFGGKKAFLFYLFRSKRGRRI